MFFFLLKKRKFLFFDFSPNFEDFFRVLIPEVVLTYSTYLVKSNFIFSLQFP